MKYQILFLTGAMLCLMPIVAVMVTFLAVLVLSGWATFKFVLIPCLIIVVGVELMRWADTKLRNLEHGVEAAE